MARKKKHEQHANHERWLVSYADFITLMFAFFVVMFASSRTDKAKAVAVSDAVKQAIKDGGMPAKVREVLGGTVDDTGIGNALLRGPGGAEPKTDKTAEAAELLPSAAYLTQALQDEIKAGKVDIHMESRGLVLSLRQAAFFPSGDDSIDPATYSTLEKISQTLHKLPNSIRLEGHTDAVPIHSARFRSNWELSAARGIAMLELLSARYQIPKERLAVAGYADTIPVESNATPAGRAHNRRVDIVILGHALAEAPVAQTAPQLENTTTTGAAKPSPTAILKPTAATGALQ